ncbi:DNA repair protein RecN [Castellaniella sp.]|uniref:DNA repair protein RecN n=1 Tax=Castellaniella sp. TaxID=1955812 RepID=UPI00355DF1BB
MLRALHIRDFVIVEHADLSFEPGFTVFSGETGAGKSILIDALSLALGGRGDATLVREDCTRTDISAVFEPSEAVQGWLTAQALDASELILRRVLDTQGRSKAYINGIPAPLGQVRELATLLVDIHGQHAHQSLLQAARQRDVLDAHGGHADLAAEVARTWHEWRAADAALQAARQDTRAQAAELEVLQNDVAWLDELAPTEGEWAELCATQSRLAHAQGLLAGAGQAADALDGESGSALQALHAALQALRGMLRHDPGLEPHAQALESARILCSETVSGLNAYADRIEPDPQALAEVEARMSRLFEAGRRFSVDPEALVGHHAALLERLRQLQASHDTEALEAACQQARGHYEQRARTLGQARQATAGQLSDQVTAAMQDLAMEGGQFSVQIQAAKPGPHGLEAIEFLVAGHGGVAPRPLARVASGGELARIALALSVIASQAAQVPTLIFDEVDAGIGGAVAEVVGRLLHQLGQRHQVLCVTHLPQVAACARHHWLVSKHTQQGRTLSELQALTADQRVEEIARMLGGLRLTRATRAHAREMLQMLAE